MLSRRRGIIFIGEEQIIQILNLPEDYTITGIAPHPMCGGFNLLVVSDKLPEVPPGTMPPRIPVASFPEFGTVTLLGEQIRTVVKKLALVPNLDFFEK